MAIGLQILFLYILSENLNSKIFWLVLLLSQTVIFSISIFKGSIKNKELKNLDEVKFLGAEIWLPFALVQLFAQTEIRNFLILNSFVATIFSSFIIIYALAALLVLKEQKKIILEKYKHLLN